MIKVPATEAGIPAIEELTARGVNVNVTLLFSVARYEQVIDAYLAGLERRVAAGRAGRRDRLGRLVLRLARRRQGRRRCCRPTRRCAAASRSPTPTAPTRRYRERFADERWRALRDAGARPQRPLWASTGTKDPAYSDVLYVERADRARTSSTPCPRRPCAPSPTTATPRRASTRAPARPRRRSRRAEDAGVDLAAITAELEREGVRSFCDSYRELLACIETKAQRTLAR